MLTLGVETLLQAKTSWFIGGTQIQVLAGGNCYQYLLVAVLALASSNDTKKYNH